MYQQLQNATIDEQQQDTRLSTTSVFGFVASKMDCFAPTLGHTALRCADFSKSQARVQMLPATMFLFGAWIMTVNWVRLALARRLFRFEHFLTLLLYGILTFALAVADFHNAVNRQPYGSSRVLGGLSVLSTLLMVATIFNFLPPRAALPMWLDRVLVATACSTLIVSLLAGIGSYTPDGLSHDLRNEFYASGSCLLIFLLLSLIASQNSRFFAVPINPTGEYRAFVSLGGKSNILFILSLLTLLAQTCFAFITSPRFADLMAASMLGGTAYCLLVLTSVVAHCHTHIREKTTRMAVARRRELNKRQAEFYYPSENDEDPSSIWRRHAVRRRADNPNPDDIEGNPDRAYTNEPDRVVRIDEEKCVDGQGGPDEQRDDSEHGSVIWHGGTRGRRMHTQSGLSAASWDRLEQIMRSRSDRRQAPQNSAGRPQSGFTNYGSEMSFSPAEGLATRPGSMISFAGLAAVLGMGMGGSGGQGASASASIPPVPQIDKKYLFAPAKSDPDHANVNVEDLAVAKPLTPGEKPIPLTSTSDIAAKTSASKSYPPRRRIPDLTAMLWGSTHAQKKGATSHRRAQGASSPTTIGSPPPAATPRIKPLNLTVDSSTGRSSNITLVHKPSTGDESPQMSLAARYNSSKLFPCAMLTDSQSTQQYLDVPSTGSATHEDDRRYGRSNRNLAASPEITLPAPAKVAVSATASSWRASVLSGSTNPETGHFAQLQDSLLQKQEQKGHAASNRPSSTLSLSEQTATHERQLPHQRSTYSVAGGAGEPPSAPLTTHKEEEHTAADVIKTASTPSDAGPSSPRSDIQKETQHEYKEKESPDRRAKVASTPPHTPSPNGKLPTPSKVNRGKVVRKVEVEEDQSVRMKSAIRFPSSPPH